MLIISSVIYRIEQSGVQLEDPAGCELDFAMNQLK
jgi:hypothetical protein